MAHLTKDWLKGDAQRSRRHGLEKVTLKLLPDSDFSCDHTNVRTVIEITSEYAGEYHRLYVTDKDLTKLLPEFLASLKDPEFLSCVGNAFIQRRQEP
jgi:hypothetical protein